MGSVKRIKVVILQPYRPTDSYKYLYNVVVVVDDAAAAADNDDDDDCDCNCDYDHNEIIDTINSVSVKYVCSTGYILVLLNVVNVVSAVTTCYPVNGQQYCFYTDGSTVLNRNEARQFCSSRKSTLPIIKDTDIDNVFQRFISENNLVEVSGSNAQQMNNYVWLDAHARQVNNSDPWHWINGQPSGSSHALLSLAHHGYSRQRVVIDKRSASIICVLSDIKLAVIVSIFVCMCPGTDLSAEVPPIGVKMCMTVEIYHRSELLPFWWQYF